MPLGQGKKGAWGWSNTGASDGIPAVNRNVLAATKQEAAATALRAKVQALKIRKGWRTLDVAKAIGSTNCSAVSHWLNGTASITSRVLMDSKMRVMLELEDQAEVEQLLDDLVAASCQWAQQQECIVSKNSVASLGGPSPLGEAMAECAERLSS